MSNISCLFTMLCNNAVQAETNVPKISFLSLRNTHHHLTRECPSWPSPFSMYTWHCHHFPAPALIKGNSRQRTTEITEATEAVLSYRLQTALPFAAKPKKKNLCLCSQFWSQLFNRVNLTGPRSDNCLWGFGFELKNFFITEKHLTWSHWTLKQTLWSFTSLMLTTHSVTEWKLTNNPSPRFFQRWPTLLIQTFIRTIHSNFSIPLKK